MSGPYYRAPRSREETDLMMWNRLTASVLFAVLVLVSSGCAGDDTASEPGNGSDSVVDDEPTTTTGSPDSEVTTPNDPLPASARGVTSDTITIGVAEPDFAPLVAIGQPFNWGSARIAYETYFGLLNARGGVGGRMIEGVYSQFDFLDNASQDRACIDLSEDHEVFMVMHGVLRDANLCFTEIQGTMVSTEGMLNAERIERSTAAPWFSTAPRDDETLEISAEALARSGRLDGRTVGIVATVTNEYAVDALAGALRANGIEPSIAIANATPNDITATRDAYALISEQFKTEAVDFVFTIGDVAVVIETFDSNGLDVDYALSSGANLAAIATAMEDSSPADGAVAVSFLPDDELWQHPDFESECLEPFREANPDLVGELEKLPTDVDQAAGEVAWVGPIRRACFDTIFFAAVAAEAGPDLTHESFLAALDRVGTIDYPGWGVAHYRSDKWDGLDTFYLQEFDSGLGENGGVRVVGDPIVVER